MFNNPEQFLFLIIGIVILIFAPIIIFSLRYRAKLQERWAFEICAETVAGEMLSQPSVTAGAVYCAVTSMFVAVSIIFQPVVGTASL